MLIVTHKRRFIFRKIPLFGVIGGEGRPADFFEKLPPEFKPSIRDFEGSKVKRWFSVPVPKDNALQAQAAYKRKVNDQDVSFRSAFSLKLNAGTEWLMKAEHFEPQAKQGTAFCRYQTKIEPYDLADAPADGDEESLENADDDEADAEQE